MAILSPAGDVKNSVLNYGFRAKYIDSQVRCIFIINLVNAILNFKGYFESTMRLSLFLYTNKEKKTVPIYRSVFDAECRL